MSSKFHITDNQWYWDIDESKALNDLKDKETLKERGKYLVEIVDKIPDKASYHDIDQIPSGKQVITWGPSSGKTTAIRQWLYRSESVIYCAKTILEIDRMYYDLIAMHHYLDGPIIMDDGIIKFHSETPDVKLEDLPKYNTVLCTHERLFLEPQYLLLALNPQYAYLSGSVTRKYLIVDEYPVSSKFYQINDQVINLYDSINLRIPVTAKNENEIRRYEYLKKLLYETTDDRQIACLKRLLPKLVDKSLYPITDVSVSRVAYFAAMVLNKLDDPTIKSGDKIFYSLVEFPVQNIWLFDGTGDLSFKDSTKWNILKHFRFNRKLQLNKPVKILPNTAIDRYIKSEVEAESVVDRVDKYVQALLEIIPYHKKVLIYSWKKLKLSRKFAKKVIQDEFGVTKRYEDSEYSIEDLIKIGLPVEFRDKVEFIYYQSGKDRATNEYSDCDAIVILGKFFIPGLSIYEFNKINECHLSNIDNMNALLIQAIYRTQARRGKPISIYMSEDFDLKDISNLIRNYDFVTCNGFDYKRILLTSYRPENSQEILSKIYKYYNKKVSTAELSKILDIRSDKILERLDAANINYRILGKESRSTLIELF